MLPVERPHWGEGQKGIAWTCIDLLARDCVRVTSLSGSASDCWLRLSRGMIPRESSHNNTVELESKNVMAGRSAMTAPTHRSVTPAVM